MSRTLLLLGALFLLLGGCEKVDLRQAAVCEAAAEVLVPGAGRLTSANDPAYLHAIATRVATQAGERRLLCIFTSANEKSADQMALNEVELDGAALDAVEIDRLHAALEARGVYWKVSWIPTMGPPHGGELAEATPEAAALYLAQLVLNALPYGAVIGLIALGYTLVASVIGVINLAFGDIFMMGAFAAIVAVGVAALAGAGGFPLGVLMALPLVMGVAALWNASTDVLVFRHLRSGAAQIPLIASIGVSLVLQGVVANSAGAKERWMQGFPAPSFELAAAPGFALTANRQQLLTLAVTVALFGATALVITRTRFGRQLRACAQDRRMAALVGVDVERIVLVTFAGAGGLAGAAGLLEATYYGGVSVVMGTMMGLKAITAAVLGGVGNWRGALAGGLVVALAESLTAGYLYSGYKELAVFAILVLLMIFRPEGIFGEG